MKIKIEIDTENKSANSIEVNYNPEEDRRAELDAAQVACNELFVDYKRYF